jgi:hypothetical protein
MNRSPNYVTTLSAYSQTDVEILANIRQTVKAMNKVLSYEKNAKKYRVCVKGRKPFEKKEVYNMWTGKRSVRGYGQGGNIVGGISNAQKYDVYIYERYAD